MRFIGNKEKLLETIYTTVLSTGIDNGVFCDFFSGTSNVGRFFKEKGFRVISSDLLYFSYVLQRAYITNNTEPGFKKLLKTLKVSGSVLFPSPFDQVRTYLNGLKGVKGFIYRNYTEEGTAGKENWRKYFLPENGKKIDALRIEIEKWYKSKLINENEYFVLLAALIESVPFYANISGVYAAFLKNYDPRALKPFEIKPIKFYKSSHGHKVFNGDSMNLIGTLNVDVLYLDPPYNERQYASNYHLLETIAKYDNPKIKGITGMRNYSEQKSEFCNKETALIALDKVARNAKYKRLILSYNTEGIMLSQEILDVLRQFGTVELKNIEYPRYKSNSNGRAKELRNVHEQLYVLRP